jgi:hypothetical protein
MEPLVCPLLNTVVNIRTYEKDDSRENCTTVHASWEQNASAQGSIKIPPREIFLLRVVATQIPKPR